ncbi:MAG: restriction endonuclease subunit S [Treponema sp.]|nr:restriction endonuclease subunit S [Treponema sp.]
MSDNNSTANTIPAEWTKTLQGEICRLGNGEKSQVAGFPYFEVKYLRGQKPKTLVNEGRFVLKDNKVIIVDGENSGEVFTIPENGYMGSTCKVLEINPKIDEKFLLYFIASKKQLYRNKKKGSAIPHLDKKLFAEMPFAYPELLSEQQRIVAKIEELFSKLDAGIESLKKAKLLLAVYRQAVLKESFEQKENWRCVKLSDIGAINLGRQRSPKNISKDYPTKYIRAANITETGIDVSDILEMEFTPKEREKYYLKKNDIILSEASGSASQVGKPAIWKNEIENCCFQNTVIRHRIAKDNPEYVFWYYKYLYMSGYFSRKVGGVGINHLGANNFSDFEINIPVSMEEQSSIVSQIESRLTVCDKIERTVNESLEKADVLRRSILKKAFEGGL